MITLNNSTETITPSIQSNTSSSQRENQNTDLRVDQQVNRRQNTQPSSNQQQERQQSRRAESEDKPKEVKNREDTSKQVLNQLDILNEKQSQATDPRARQDLIRSFNDLASRLQIDSRLEKARTEFNPNDPEQTRQAIKQAQEKLNNQDNQLITGEDTDDNTDNAALVQRARESITQAVNNQENTRVQILTPQQRKQEPEQPFIDASSERTQSPQQQQQENPFGKIS